MATIQELNDGLRRAAGGAPLPACYAGGLAPRINLSEYVSTLGPFTQALLLNAVARFDHWPEGNDPYGEHDFGTIELKGERFFFKIDYYNADLDGGAEDPANVATCCRVMTLMHASEY